MRADTILRRTAFLQGVYYLVSGIWPLLDLRTFYLVTGPKKEGWLVKTVGALVAVNGAGLLVGTRRGTPGADMAITAGGSAAALAVVDVFYATRGRIRPVYLLDAVPEALLALAWLAGWLMLRREQSRTVPATTRAEARPSASEHVAGLETDPYATPTV